MSIWSKLGRSIAIIALVVLPGVALAQAVPPGAPAPATTTATPKDPAAAADSAEYVLGPDDVIEYSIIGSPDRSRGRIYSDGTIQTHLGIRVDASGKTPAQLAVDLGKAFKAAGFYADPVVVVDVVGYASRYVTVLGAVVQPGLVPLSRPFRLSEILARVGGVRGDAASYIVVQSADGKEKRFNVDKIAAGGPEDDPLVFSGSKLFAPAAEMFYITGQVRSPGSYPIKSGMTIAQAIAASGGLTESGTDKKVKVRRGVKIETLKVDAPVQAGDVITISERLF